MGNLFCSPEDNINLSSECIRRLQESRNATTSDDADASQSESEEVEDKRWFEKVEPIVPAPPAPGKPEVVLTIEDFNQLFDQVEKRIFSKQFDKPCGKEQILSCLERNPDNMMKCKEEMDNFIDCVDTIRIKIMKRKLEEKKKAEKI